MDAAMFWQIDSADEGTGTATLIVGEMPKPMRTRFRPPLTRMIRLEYLLIANAQVVVVTGW
jgi:hypothetical protein